MQILGKIGNYLKNFFNSMECFRFVLFGALFFGIERVSNITMGIIMLWSMYLFIYKLIIKKGIQRIRYRKIIYLFLGAAAFTVMLHRERNLADNLIVVYFMAVYFFQIYGLYSEKSNIRCQREIKRILLFIVSMTTVMMLIGFIGLVMFPKGFEWKGLYFILHESRFIGILFNANVAGFYSAMAIIACHILWRITRAQKQLSVKRKIFYLSCIAVNALSLFLTDSNAALLFLVTYCSFVMFYIMFRDFGKKRMHGFILRIAATALSFVVIITSLIFFRVITQSQVSLAITSGHSPSEFSTGVVKEDGMVGLTDDEYKGNVFGHENKNIDSGRFRVWTQAVEMFELFPVMGIGKANIVDYANSYIGGLRYSDFHNGLLTILISYGLIGLNLFIVFSIVTAKDILKTIFQYKKKCRDDGSVPVLLTAFCIAYAVYSMFELALLADISYRVYIFWLLLGFAVSYVRKYRLQARLEETDQSVIELPSAVENIRRKHIHKFLYIRACIRKLKAKYKSGKTKISDNKNDSDFNQSESAVKIRRKHKHKFLYIRACIRKLKAKAKSKHKSNSTEISDDKDNDDSKQSEESSE